jgi:hypothetical protein
VQDFLQSLATAGLFGGEAEDACYVICDERVNSETDAHEGRINLLVGLRTARTGEYLSFLVTHSVDGSRVRTVRSHRLPAGMKMRVEAAAEEAQPGDTQRQKTLAQELFGYYVEPRPEPSVPAFALPAESAAPGRRDLDAVARFYADLGRRGQRF